jgi:hypothetical protein
MRYAVLVFLSAMLATAQATTPPQLLTDALIRLPGLTILNPASDLRGTLEADVIPQLEKWGAAWIQADFNHDGLLDVAAVVTARASRTRFGLLAVLSGDPARIHWILPLREQPVYGVAFFALNDADGASLTWHDRIVPLDCVACDANEWMRWSGRTFEVELYAEYDVLAVDNQDIFGEPREGAKIIAKSGPCARVRTVDFRGQDPETRWYLIETFGAKPKRGWVPASAIIETNEARLCWD